MNSYRLNEIGCTLGDFALSVPDWSLEKGKIIAIVGPNGSGKSSLLDVLAFLHPVSRGQLRFKGERVDYADSGRLLDLRRQVGYLMQTPYLFNMKVAENIAYGLNVRRLPHEDVERRVRVIMERMSLSHLAERNAHELSGGEAQRVALARTLVLDTDVVLLDEPTASVDRPNVRMVEKAVLDICGQRNATVVLTTHSLDQAHRLSEEPVSIIDGCLHRVAYDNVFEGVREAGNVGIQSVSVAAEIAFPLADAGPAGRVTIVVESGEIILSRAKPDDGSGKAFHGTIIRMDAVAAGLRLFVDVGVTLSVLVSRECFASIRPAVGEKVWVTVNAGAVKVLG